MLTEENNIQTFIDKLKQYLTNKKEEFYTEINSETLGGSPCYYDGFNFNSMLDAIDEFSKQFKGGINNV